jgi:hypothetical protein
MYLFSKQETSEWQHLFSEHSRRPLIDITSSVSRRPQTDNTSIPAQTDKTSIPAHSRIPLIDNTSLVSTRPRIDITSNWKVVTSFRELTVPVIAVCLVDLIILWLLCFPLSKTFSNKQAWGEPDESWPINFISGHVISAWNYIRSTPWSYLSTIPIILPAF